MTYHLQTLSSKAHELALSHSPKIKSRQPRYLNAGVAKHIEQIRASVLSLNREAHICSQPADEWLLDNSEFLEEQAEELKLQLEKRNLRYLPYMKTSEQLRIHAICKQYLSVVDGVWSESSFLAFVNAYQEIAVLTINEIWSLPIVLRAAFLDQIAEVVSLVQERREACLAVDKLLSSIEPEQINAEVIQQKLREAQVEMPLSGPWIVHLIAHLREWQGDAQTVREWLQCQYDNGLEDLNQIITYEYQLQASYQLTAGSLITSMRSIERMDWQGIAEQLCLPDQTYRQSQKDYGLLDASSRNSLLSRTAELAARLKVPENLIAQQAVKLANGYKQQNESNKEPAPRSVFVAFYLLDPAGVKQLLRALKACSKTSPDMRRMFSERAAGTYMSSSVILLVILTILAGAWVGLGRGIGWLGWVCMLLVAIWPMSEWVMSITHYGIEKLCRPRPLLRLDLSEKIPADAATMVVIPAIWSSAEEINELADQLEIHYLANRDRHIHFALLGDFTDSREEVKPEDQALLETGKARIDELNDRYNHTGTTFHFLQRRRKWNESENIYMGWERKRGKLVEFVDMLKGSQDTSYFYQIGDSKVYSAIRYIITLDADTQLPISSAARMIGAIHLPYNRPRLNTAGTRVVEGYGVLQPRIGVSHPSALRSRLAFLSSEPGIDPYVFAASDPYQDALSEAIFTGKGIFDVDVFYQVLCERIPDNRVLSHDLLEGGFLRAGLLCDVELIDDHPSTFVAYQKRLHRWVRGDWQLICWLLPSLHNRRGELMPIDLSIITKWQLIDNLRRSLLPIAYFLLILLAVTILPGSLLRWMLVLAITLLLPAIRQLPSIYKEKQLRRVSVALFQAAVQFVMLPFQTALLLHAICKTLYRLIVSKRHLLEWTSSSHVERARKSSYASLPLVFVGGGYALIALAVIVAIIQPSLSARWLTVILCLIWAVAPMLASWLDQPVIAARRPLDEGVKHELKRLAKEIWAFYEAYAGQEDHYLPPDNVQLEPDKGVAHRTSPTNIGFLLTSIVAARDFDFITAEQLLDRMEQTLTTVEKLEKWHGHLYNWYDTQSLRVLHPAYVSTVDSGNFVASMMTVKQALVRLLEEQRYKLQAIEAAEEREQKLQFIHRMDNQIDRLEHLITATDFRQLYDDKAKLFVLGYHADTDKRDTILYDLLASEARQASFVAIALGQISVAHWSVLGRSVKQAAGYTYLLSWTGTMFEYMMPWLIMRTYANTLWDSTYKGIIQRQIDYARENAIPFGISESGYYAFDYNMNYQYRAFGVPGLGFKRGLEQDLVVAPYASIMALPYAIEAGMDNLRELELIGARGQYGFYEAIDFTPSRLPRGSEYKVIRSFMAHHQGMSMLTLANMLLPVAMYDYFHQDKRVQAAELLLTERIPPISALMKRELTIKSSKAAIGNRQAGPLRQFEADGKHAIEQNIQSNGSFTTAVTNSGSGYIQYNGLDISRWREDAVLDPWGVFVYIRNASSSKLWSPAYQPCQIEQENSRVQFFQEKTLYYSEYDDVGSMLEVSVSPELNAEIRELTLTNKSQEAKVLEITSFMEIAMAGHEADKAHPAFSRLFIQTEMDAASGSLLANKRPRQASDKPLWVFHRLYVVGDEGLGAAEYETNRAQFIGRGYSLRQPKGITERLSGKTGSVADPAFVMRRRIRIEAGKTAQLVMITGAADSRNQAVELAIRLSDRQQIARSKQLAWTYSQIELAHLHIKPHDIVAFQQLGSRIRYRTELQEQQAEAIRSLKSSQQGLWAHGISGDRPILLIRASDTSQLPFLLKLFTGCVYLWRNGLQFDAVVWNESLEGYQQQLRDELVRLADQLYGGLDGPYGSFRMISAASADQADQHLLFAAARFVVHADGPSLQAQTVPLEKQEPAGSGLLSAVAQPNRYQHATMDLKGLEESGLFDNGYGSFSADGSEYRIKVRRNQPLPAPWINVLSNPQFGCIISEMFTGYTWWSNSRECKLTPWSNDPALDPAGEACYIRDELSGEVWQPVPSRLELEDAEALAIHGQGYSRFERSCYGIVQQATVFVPLKDPVKVMKLRLINTTEDVRELSVTYYAEWVLGVHREDQAAMVITQYDESSHSLIAHNTYQENFRDAHAFLTIAAKRRNMNSEEGEDLSWTADRFEFIGQAGSVDQPDGMRRKQLSGTVGALSNSCGTMQLKLSLQPGEERDVYILLGCTDSGQSASQLAIRYRDSDVCREQYEAVLAYWNNIKGTISVSTPSQELDIMINHWLMYQTIACRLWARTAFYQAGGAYGYRDQLQDSLALLHFEPSRTKAQILLHAEHQYEEGDVQHWWHEETQRGIRTRFSDDLLWLPYAVLRYIDQTGDDSILDLTAPYLHSAPLGPDEHERYEETVRSEQVSSIAEHCFRAIDRSLPVGEHGLPLIGIGDWNDGMSMIGPEGRGESVWLGWFLGGLLPAFSEISKKYGDEGRAQRYAQCYERLVAALNNEAWDGKWFRRAFTDSGQWLGTIEHAECRIDAIAQSWSVISGMASEEKAEQAMQSFDQELVDRSLQLARILTPPFDETNPSPGYIQGYPPGIRENGAQYTHGVIWSILAWSKLEQGGKGFELFNLLNPINHAKSAQEAKIYAGEPYVMAADVYSEDPNKGHAGWTWYTGASGWMYQAGVEWIIGLRKRGNYLYIRPSIPSDWPGYSIQYRAGEAEYHIEVRNPEQRTNGVSLLKINGQQIAISDDEKKEGAKIPIANDDRIYKVEITM
ncbi:GH36-type glycosyl hydrolase domain-containing protein [Paenibacillus sp. IITD108]|uniref:GH36-type glycosyl hydrolase domain-containing protein n=1 Tax=Paenibacillus sp. IITD108 TaxID=3116649 RepID=UPI002F42A6C6